MGIAAVNLDVVIVALVICSTLLFLATMIIWCVMRYYNRIGPLAAAEQQRQIEKERAQMVLEAKELEAKTILADAKLVEANAKLTDAQLKTLGTGKEDHE